MLHVTVLPPQPIAGTRPLLAFHGIGQTGPECYAPLAEQWSEHYTVYAFDLYFHGRQASTAPIDASQAISKKQLAEQISTFLQKEGIDRFDVIGFSIGGRFAMATLEAFADRIDKAYLIAPDGVSEHPVYHMATRWPLGRLILKRQMTHPQLFFKLVRGLKNIGLVNKSLLRFTEQIMNTNTKRLRLYNAWVGFRRLRFDIPAWYVQIARQPVELYLIVGEYDKLLKPSAVKPLAKLLPHDHFLILPGGHTTVVDKAVVYLSREGII
ncbi:alpha/beta fold hydrolase [Dyadobacter jejuensis]|nr:alpha/beta fold hydrolase [Dyadobacter jejuensis]